MLKLEAAMLGAILNKIDGDVRRSEVLRNTISKAHAIFMSETSPGLPQPSLDLTLLASNGLVPYPEEETEGEMIPTTPGPSKPTHPATPFPSSSTYAASDPLSGGGALHPAPGSSRTDLPTSSPAAVQFTSRPPLPSTTPVQQGGSIPVVHAPQTTAAGSSSATTPSLLPTPFHRQRFQDLERASVSPRSRPATPVQESRSTSVVRAAPTTTGPTAAGSLSPKARLTPSGVITPPHGEDGSSVSSLLLSLPSSLPSALSTSDLDPDGQVEQAMDVGVEAGSEPDEEEREQSPAQGKMKRKGKKKRVYQRAEKEDTMEIESEENDEVEGRRVVRSRGGMVETKVCNHLSSIPYTYPACRKLLLMFTFTSAVL